MVKHSRIGKVRVQKESKSTLNEVKLSLYKKCTEISLLYDIQIFVAITDDKHNLSVLSTKTEVSEYISSTLKVPLNATEIFTSKSVSILFICSSPIMILNLPTQKKKMIIKTKIVLLSMQQLSLRHSPTSLNIRKITIESKYHY